MKVHSWFNTDSSFVTAPETLISPNLKHEKQQVCFCFQFFCSLGWVETIILIIQKRPAMHTEDAVRTRSLAALCSSSMGLHLINSARHRSWVCEELSRTPQLQKQAECHRQSVCCYLWAPGWISLSEAVLAEVEDESSLTEVLILDTCAKSMSYPIGHWILFLSWLFSNAALSFDIHPSAQRSFYVSMFRILLAESHGQKKIFS